MEKLTSGQIRKATRLFVISELTIRGWKTNSTRVNDRNMIIATNDKTTVRIIVSGSQMRDTKTNARRWILHDKDGIRSNDDHLYYVLVFYDDFDKISYSIVPANDVADWIKDNHGNWLELDPDHNDSNIRQFIDLTDKYLDKWNTLQ